MDKPLLLFAFTCILFDYMCNCTVCYRMSGHFQRRRKRSYSLPFLWQTVIQSLSFTHWSSYYIRYYNYILIRSMGTSESMQEQFNLFIQELLQILELFLAESLINNNWHRLSTFSFEFEENLYRNFQVTLNTWIMFLKSKQNDLIMNKRPMGHITYLRYQSYDYIIRLIWREQKDHLLDDNRMLLFCKTQNPLHQRMLMPSIVEIGLVVLEKKNFKFHQFIFAIS